MVAGAGQGEGPGEGQWLRSLWPTRGSQLKYRPPCIPAFCRVTMWTGEGIADNTRLAYVVSACMSGFGRPLPIKFDPEARRGR